MRVFDDLEYECTQCGKECDDDYKINSDYFCSDTCVSSYGYVQCSSCDGYIHYADSIEISDSGSFCDIECIEEYGYVQCYKCEDYVEKRRAFEFEGDDYCGTSCADVETCKDCGDYVSNDDAIEIDSDYYCNEDCANKSDYYACENCGEYTEEKEIVEFEDKKYCSKQCGELLDCDKCSEIIKYNDVFEKNDNVYCSHNCLEEDGYFVCNECSTVEYKEKVVLYKGKSFCSEECKKSINCKVCTRNVSFRNSFENKYCSKKCKELDYDSLDKIMVNEDRKYMHHLKEWEDDRYFKLIQRLQFIYREKYIEMGWQPHPKKGIYLFKLVKGDTKFYINASCVYIEKDGKYKELSNFNKADNLGVLVSLYNKGLDEIKIFIDIFDFRRNINKYLK